MLRRVILRVRGEGRGQRSGAASDPTGGKLAAMRQIRDLSHAVANLCVLWDVKEGGR